MACMSVQNNLEGDNIFYTCGKQNGNGASFMVFVELMIANKWFKRHDILVLDNAAIHGGA